jgi:hypothetical protein
LLGTASPRERRSLVAENGKKEEVLRDNLKSVFAGEISAGQKVDGDKTT